MVDVVMEWLEGADRSLGFPTYATHGSAGADLRANLPGRIEIVLAQGARVLVPIGLRIGLPPGFEAQIRPRSGLALNHGITLPNAPGTIDSDYRGPLAVIVLNSGAEPFTIRHGDRIAQMVIAPVAQAVFVSGTLDETKRAAGGFGSTGVD